MWIYLILTTFNKCYYRPCQILNIDEVIEWLSDEECVQMGRFQLVYLCVAVSRMVLGAPHVNLVVSTCVLIVWHALSYLITVTKPNNMGDIRYYETVAIVSM